MEKYENIRVVGRGAYGTVNLCRRQNDGKFVIIKQIPVEQMSKEERQAALNEGRVLAMLHHPNIIEYYENFLEDKALMIVMEYAPGGTLYEYLQMKCDSLLEEEEILQLFAQMVLSLHHVHSRQILHRDLKTQNILLNKEKNIVKIGDFGISKILSSKSKAYTVVGTPCYISPELCEGRPYNQKSDIWALGCILYELLTLKRAFEASTLPALILKIMRGSFTPIADHYSDDLKQLLLNMLHLDPNKRPSTNQIMAQPVIINAIANLHTDIGKIPYVSRSNHTILSNLMNNNSKSGTEKINSDEKHDSSLKSVIYAWGGNITVPCQLPLLHNDSIITQIATGRTQRIAVTTSGRVVMWESNTLLPESSVNLTGTSSLLIPRFLEGQSALTITQVSCGDLFTAFLTDRGILLTFGSGLNGCLGHGDFNDISQPKIVEALLGYEVTNVSCGNSHVIVVTNDHEVFSWGRGENGRLGLGHQQSYSLPQPVPLSEKYSPKLVVCGVDCSVVITSCNQLIACGSNRFNKLGLDVDKNGIKERVDETLSFLPLQTFPWNSQDVVEVALGFSHMAVLTDVGEVFTTGDNRFGQLGRNESSSTPHLGVVDTLLNYTVKHIAAGDAFTIAVTSNGKIFSWGKGMRARLGFYSDSNVTIPHCVTLPSSENYTITSVACNCINTLILATLN